MLLGGFDFRASTKLSLYPSKSPFLTPILPPPTCSHRAAGVIFTSLHPMLTNPQRLPFAFRVKSPSLEHSISGATPDLLDQNLHSHKIPLEKRLPCVCLPRPPLRSFSSSHAGLPSVSPTQSSPPRICPLDNKNNYESTVPLKKPSTFFQKLSHSNFLK